MIMIIDKKKFAALALIIAVWNHVTDFKTAYLKSVMKS